MILIVEGMDRCGKTTLVNNLRKNYFKTPKLIVHHSSAPPAVPDRNDWEVDHYSSLLSDFMTLSDKKNYDIILDRFHLGSIVYGSRFRNMDPKRILEIDKLYFETYENAATILLTDFPESIATRDDGESIEVSREEFEETRGLFIENFEKSKCKHKLHLNITENGGVKNTYKSVATFLDSVNMR